MEKVSKLADDLERFGILNTFDKIAVVKARDRKCSMLAESKLPVAQKDTASALRAALALNLKISLVVDGYNVLHLLPEVFGQAYEDGIPRKEARDSMIEKMKRGLENHPNTQCLLFFDGPREKSEAVAKNLTIAYSGGAAGTKNRADDAIIKQGVSTSANASFDCMAFLPSLKISAVMLSLNRRVRKGRRQQNECAKVFSS